MSSRRCIQVGIVLLVGSLLFFGAYFLRKPRKKAITTVPAEEAPAIPVQRNTSSAQNSDAAFFLSGNVFHPSRGQVTPASAAPQAAVPAVIQKNGQFELTGIFRYQNTGGALIAVHQLSANSKKTKSRRMYKLGDSLGNGYNLVEISDTHVVISRGNEKINLPLKKQQDTKK